MIYSNKNTDFFSVTRTLYSLNILYQETDSTVLCKNKLAGEMARNEVDYKQLKDDLKNPNVLIIDVREPSEIAQTGKMEEAIHIRCRNLLLCI